LEVTFSLTELCIELAAHDRSVLLN